MSKRTSFENLLGTGTAETTPDDAPPVSALLHTITGNPDNPRDVDELDIEELVASFRQVGQLQPVLALSRDAYLKHKPLHRKVIGDAEFVVLGGNRRLEAARALGWARIDIQVRDDLADGDEGSLDEAVIIENIHRKALSPMKEAGFLHIMVGRYGSQSKVAERIGKTQAYVSQRISLLNLTPELQEAVDKKQLKVKEARKIASAAPAEQQEALAKVRSEPKKRESARTVSHNPVMTGHLDGQPKGQDVRSVAAENSGAGHNPVMTESAPTADQQAPLPDQRDSPPPKPQIKVPWEDGQVVAEMAIRHMPSEQLAVLLNAILEHQAGTRSPA
ncbi:ParB/RepB/Spo0J family partition protein [Streptomyces sp. NPDC059076]|uniref:ParB/RepB/Spo0J family partition protein n=1 Tax=unclassified Streptomyces TaxID=2593676 RepID=UPI0036B4A8E6